MGNYNNMQTKQWYLEGQLNNGKPWTIPINKAAFLIGRKEDCDLSILSKNVSRQHAEIYYNGATLTIKDLNSKNGTMVNNKRLKKVTQIKHGDTISFANIKFKIVLKKLDKADTGSGTYYFNIPNKEDNFVRYYDLTKREEEILYCILQGKSTKNIADTLFITEGTAKNHVLNIYKKTNVHSRFELFTLYNNFNATEYM